MKLIEKVFSGDGCLTHLFFLFVILIFIFSFSPFGLFIAGGIVLLRLHFHKKRKFQLKKEIEKERRESAHKRYQEWLKTPLWRRRGFPSEEEFLAEKERLIRKQEQDHFLAHSYRQRHKLSKLKKNLSTVDDLLKLTPVEFERWVRKNIFEKENWEVTETKVIGDGGIDLILNRKNEHSIAQCKRFKKTVGEPLIRDFYGAMISEGVSRGYFVTTGLFSLSALKFAEGKPIEMIDRRILAQKYL